MDPGQTTISGGAALEACVTAFADAPRRAALLCDIDGTLAPIVARPADAAVPAATRELLAALVPRLGLVAFVTGRALDDGRRMIDLPGAAYVGTHGLEIVSPDGSAWIDPQAEGYVEALREVTAAAARDLDCARLGVVLEDKRTVLAVHYRLAPDAAATRHEILTRVVEPARERGLAIGTGHFLFEVRPPVPFSKGAALTRLLGAGDFAAALFCGDDLTDVTAFRALHEWGMADGRRTACALAAVTAETPRPVTDAADVQVRATPGVTAALRRLVAATGG